MNDEVSSATRPAPSGLNDSHRRAIVHSFARIDDLLRRVEMAASDDPSPFSRYAADIAPAQRQVLNDYGNRLRATMQRALSTLGISDERTKTSARSAIQTTLSFVGVTLDDMAPSHLAGYGRIEADAARSVERVIAELQHAVDRMRAYLAQGLGADFAARLDRLAQVPVDLDLVRAIERVVTGRGLVEFRGLMASLIEQLETGAFEIAVFGRVSSGKSSLFNSVLGTSVLPVGVTPVTSVATRIVWGAQAGARIQFAEGPAAVVPVERLEEFVTERGNPENRKRVLRVDVRIPAPRLRSGAVFVDTPGIGSIATSGARETYAYLPRCDLGVVLVEAAGGVGPEDLAILRQLLDSGIAAMIVLSKADLVGESDREVSREYVRSSVNRTLGTDVPVHLVSTRGEDAALANQWFVGEIEPLLARSRALAEASARRKAEHLRESVVAVLEIMQSGTASRPDNAEDRDARIDALVAKAHDRIDAAERSCAALADRARNEITAALDCAASEIAERVADGREGDVAASSIVTRALKDFAEEIGAGVQSELIALRDELRGCAIEMLGMLGMEPIGPEGIQLDLLARPRFEMPAEVDALVVRWPAWATLVSALAARRARTELARRIGTLAARAASDYAALLRDWSRGVISRAATQFESEVEPLRAQSSRLREGQAKSTPDPSLAADLNDLRRPLAPRPGE